MIAETNGTGAAGTLREYIWLPETEIAPTFNARAPVDRPLAMVEDVETASPVLWTIHVDHLNRPVKMTNAAKASVWDAVSRRRRATKMLAVGLTPQHHGVG